MNILKHLQHLNFFCRTPTQSHLAVPGRKRTGKCLSGPAGIQSTSGPAGIQSTSGTAHLKPTGEKPIIKNKAAIRSGMVYKCFDLSFL